MMIPTRLGYSVKGAAYRGLTTPYPFPYPLYFSLHE